jgi:uncharacterized protein
MSSLNLTLLDGRFAVCRLPPESLIPPWAYRGAICSVTITADELSIICNESAVPSDVQHQGGWACLKLQGPFEFTLTGILTSLLNPLRDAGIGIFAMSTYDTDYVMVPGDRLEDALRALADAGHLVSLGPKL